jgi:hypothetical protein
MPEPVPQYTIDVFCDDGRHDAGEIEEVAKFGRFTLPHGEVRWLIWDSEGQSWNYTVRPGANVEIHRRYGADSGKGSTYHWRCNQCPRSLEASENSLHQLLEATHQGLLKTDPGQHMSRVNLAMLRLISDSI